jgi:thiamine pyrophosphate-dependent acetolactate synthase large subunit-like protein
MATETGLSRPNTRKVMNRADLTKRLVSMLEREEAVVGGIGFTNFDLWGAGPRPQNFYMLGSMGLAFPIALGVALAQPGRKVVGLEGDGSLLMQLGALSTIASLRQKNLVLVVWDNGAYQITGGQPATTATVADLVALARASGLEKAYWAEDETHFEELVGRALGEDGPFFIGAKIDNSRPTATTHRDPVQIRERFMRGLGVRKEPQLTGPEPG